MSIESQEDWRKETQEDTTKAACIEWWNKEDNHWWDTKEDQVFNSGKQVQSEENKMIWCELNILFKSTVEKKKRHVVFTSRNWCLGSFPQCNDSGCTGRWRWLRYLLFDWLSYILHWLNELHDYCSLFIDLFELFCKKALHSFYFICNLYTISSYLIVQSPHICS